MKKKKKTRNIKNSFSELKSIIKDYFPPQRDTFIKMFQAEKVFKRHTHTHTYTVQNSVLISGTKKKDLKKRDIENFSLRLSQSSQNH